MMRYYLNQIIKIILISTVLLGGYYFLYIQPKLVIPNALIDAERSLSTHYYTLIENRAAYTELTKLDATSTNFSSEKDNILAKLKKTNEVGLKKLGDPNRPKKIKGAPSETLNLINNDLGAVYPTLLAKNGQIYNDQQKLIDSITEFDTKVTNIYAYDPQADLDNLDFEKQKDDALERIANAKNGLNKIKDDISKSDQKYEKISDLVKEIDTTTALLTQLEKSLNDESYQDSQDIKQNLYNQFSNVKGQIFEVELSVIRSPESVKLLTEQTNLILEYEFWITKINKLHQGT